MLRPGQRLDQYEVVRNLGRGAYASTWLARDVASDELVVLKIPDAAALPDAESAARFRREAAISHRLRHSGILAAARSLPPRSSNYLAFEYVEGRTLRDWLAQNKHASAEEIVAIGLQLADALSYAHAHGVVHRDLKPENILLRDDGSVAIIDFGSALLEGARRLTFRIGGEAAGTPDYMAPEQIEGRRGDARTDLYSLGAVLYELSTGRAPFGGDNPNAVMYQHIHSEPVPPHILRPDLPAGLEAAIEKCLQKRPEDRYQSAAQLMADLERFDQEPQSTVNPAHDRPVSIWRARLARRLRHRSKT